MSGVRLSNQFCIVVRVSSLDHYKIERSRLLAIMDVSAPFDQSDHLLSFGPYRTREECQCFLEQLVLAGLQDGQDVLSIEQSLPNWVHLRADVPLQPDIDTMNNALVPLLTQNALDVWSILEALTVSLDRIGSYQTRHGTDAAAYALRAFFQPRIFRRIATARREVERALVNANPYWDEQLDVLASDADAIGYWQGEGSAGVE